MTLLFHEHVIVSAKVRLPPKDVDSIIAWKKRLVDAIGMKILMGPYATYHDMPGNRGMTIATIIETSHIVLHTWDEVDPCKFELDVYSCAPIDLGKVFDMLDEFSVIDAQYKFLDRSDGLLELYSNC